MCCVDYIQFTQLGRVVNPSRADPRIVNSKRLSADGSKSRLYVGSSFATCVTAIAVTDSYLTQPTSTGLRQCQLRGLVHCQEWDRLVAFFCMVFNQPVLNAQLYMDSLRLQRKRKAVQNFVSYIIVCMTVLLPFRWKQKNRRLYIAHPRGRNMTTNARARFGMIFFYLMLMTTIRLLCLLPFFLSRRCLQFLYTMLEGSTSTCKRTSSTLKESYLLF